MSPGQGQSGPRLGIISRVSALTVPALLSALGPLGGHPGPWCFAPQVSNTCSLAACLGAQDNAGDAEDAQATQTEPLAGAQCPAQPALGFSAECSQLHPP